MISNSWRAGLMAGALLIAQCAGQGTAGAAAAVNVPCSTTALVNAITTANAAGTPQTLNLAASCTYSLTAVAATGTRGPDGLPIITGNITLVGNNATIRRTTSTLFRILEVTGRLTTSALTIRGGDAGANTGGGVLNAQGTVSMTSTTIYSNAADNGAGISNDRGSFTLSGSTIRYNSTVPNQGGGGGGIYNDGTMTLTSTRVLFNYANTNGGGIYNELTGVLSVTGGEVTSNIAENQGGGLFNGTNGTATFTNSVIQYNTANSTGGGIYNNTCRCLITLKNTQVRVNQPNNCQPTGSVTGCTG